MIRGQVGNKNQRLSAALLFIVHGDVVGFNFRHWSLLPLVDWSTCGQGCYSTSRLRATSFVASFMARGGSCVLLRTYPPRTCSATHSPASFVPNVPPMSCVVFFCRTASSTVVSILSASFAIPR